MGVKCYGEHYNGKVFGKHDPSHLVKGEWERIEHPKMLEDADNQAILAE